MDSTKPTPEQPAMPGFGIARDLRHLKTHSAASVAELREFLAQTRGRRPQEVLGLVAGSHLMRSVAVATLGAVLVLTVGSVDNPLPQPLTHASHHLPKSVGLLT